MADASFINTKADINDPTHTAIYDIFWLVHSYITLVTNTPAMVAGRGIVKLYSYRMGVLSPDVELIEQEYIRKLKEGNQQVTQTLSTFGNSLINYNLTTLYYLVANQLTTDISRNVGNCKCLTSSAINSLYQFISYYGSNKYKQTQISDINIHDVVETLHYNATTLASGVSSISEINSFLDIGNRLATTSFSGDAAAHRHLVMALLKIIFYIGIAYYDINLLRFDDQRISRPYDRNIPINNFTLAAIPFDPVMVYSCTEDVGSMSRFGVEYIQSLEAVLSRLGGISCTITLSANQKLV